MKKDIPKFLQISALIIKKIKDGELIPGDKVPSENEIISKYKVSNTTARKSLLDIESKGWVKRMKGKGTFVLNKTSDQHITRTLGSMDTTRKGFVEKIEAEGFKSKNIILEKKIIDDGISAEIGEKNYIIDGPVLFLRQLRYADEVLLKDEIKYISLNLCPKIDLTPVEKIFYILYEEHYKLVIAEINQTLKVEIIDGKDKNYYFENTAQLPAFLIETAIITKDGKVVEVEKSYYRGDKYQFAVQAFPKMKYRKTNS